MSPPNRPDLDRLSRQVMSIPAAVEACRYIEALEARAERAEAAARDFASALREVYDYMTEVEAAHAGCCAVRSYLSLPRTAEERQAIGERARALLGHPDFAEPRA